MLEKMRFCMSGGLLQNINRAAAASEVDALLIGIVVQVHLIAAHARILGHSHAVYDAVTGDDEHPSAQRDDVLVYRDRTHADSGAGGGIIVRAAP